jgi:hypothetical protein
VGNYQRPSAPAADRDVGRGGGYPVKRFAGFTPDGQVADGGGLELAQRKDLELGFALAAGEVIAEADGAAVVDGGKTVRALSKHTGLLGYFFAILWVILKIVKKNS